MQMASGILCMASPHSQAAAILGIDIMRLPAPSPVTGQLAPPATALLVPAFSTSLCCVLEGCSRVGPVLLLPVLTSGPPSPLSVAPSPHRVVTRAQVKMAEEELRLQIAEQRINTDRMDWAIPSMDARPVLRGVDAGAVAGALTTVSNLEEDFVRGEGQLEALLPPHLDLRFLLFRLQARRDGGTATPSRSVTPLGTPRGR